MREIFPGVWRERNRIFTRSMVKEGAAYAKSLMAKGEDIFREWDPDKSKPAAAMMKGLKTFPLRKDCKVLYLGIASGATASFFSDIVGQDGLIYGVEISERSIRDLNIIAEERGNIIPILADARKPEQYAWIEPVDLVYEDVASDEQAEIIIRNSEKFLCNEGFAIMAIKSRSINVVKKPEKVYREVLEKLEKHFRIIEKFELEPYEKDHMFVVMRPRKGKART